MQAQAPPRSLDDALLVDIREAYHLAADAPADTLHAPLGLLLADPDSLPRDRPLVLRGHGRSDAAFAADFLRAQGFDARAL